MNLRRGLRACPRAALLASLLARFLLEGSPALADDAKPAPSAPSAPAASADATEGRKLFEEGVALFKDSRFAEALTKFQASYATGRRYTALRNVAECYRMLRQYPEAYTAFQALLNDHASDLKDSEKQDATRALADLALVTAGLDVAVNEPGADVLLDGTKVGTTPLPRKLRVAASRHTLRAAKPGFVAVQKDIVLLADQSGRVDLVLKPEAAAPAAVPEAPKAPCHAQIKVEPSTAALAIDGKEVGKGNYEGDLEPGEHEVTARAEGFVAYTRKITAAPGGSLVQDIALSPEAHKAEVIVPPKDEEENKRGIYGMMHLAGQFQLGGTAGLFDPCGAEQACAHSSPAGGGVGVRIGYALGPVGVEVAGYFVGEYWNQSLTASGAAIAPGTTIDATSGTKRKEDIYLLGYHAFLGAGARITSGGGVRFTAGLTPGIVFRNYALGRTVTVDSPSAPPYAYTDHAAASAFGLLADGGVLLGSSGTKLHLGLLLWVDTASGVRSAGGSPSSIVTGSAASRITLTRPQFPVTTSAQVYLGPTVGMQFGD